MRRRAACLALFLIAACGLRGFAAVDDEFRPLEEPAYPPAPELLNGVLASFPSVPIRAEAQLISKSRAGKVEKKLNTVMWLNWRGHEPEARYTIEDAFGRPLENLVIRWRRDGTRNVRYQSGDPLAEAAPPDLYAPIQETDISWIDLALAYLWWPGGKTVGAERIRSRFCYIVDLPAPANDPGQYAGVRLWIDPEIGILLQAAAYDATGQLVKLLEVKSFKKVRDVYIIQNIDIQSYPARHKTSLRVQKAEPEEE